MTARTEKRDHADMTALLKRIGLIVLWALCGLGAIGLFMQIGVPLVLGGLVVAVAARLNGRGI